MSEVFSTIPGRVLARRDMGPTAKLLYGYLLANGGGETVVRMAKALGAGTRSIYRAKQELFAAGLIDWEGHSRVYVLT